MSTIAYIRDAQNRCIAQIEPAAGNDRLAPRAAFAPEAPAHWVAVLGPLRSAEMRLGMDSRIWVTRPMDDQPRETHLAALVASLSGGALSVDYDPQGLITAMDQEVALCTQAKPRDANAGRLVPVRDYLEGRVPGRRSPA